MAHCVYCPWLSNPCDHRHVMLPKDIAKLVPKTHLMSESEWRNLVCASRPGLNLFYILYPTEPHILLFRRPLPKKPEK
uniref:Cyclin-dependent kinases regulatory subunit n=1 Tax=Coturnix japonica TaxID=93934 RepID=A0A8C2TTA5_COTJA